MKKKDSSGCCVVILVLALLASCCLTSPLSFEIASFESSIDVVLEGDANISESEIQLNLPTTKSVGRALYQTSLQLWEVDPTGNITRPADFTTHFTFNISSSITTSSGAGAGGRGICFVLVPEDSSSTSWSSTSYAGLLGLFGSKASALKGETKNRVVAVEFDMGLDPEWDPSSNHVGIDVNSIKSQTYVNVSGGGFRNKGIANVWVTYDSKAKNLTAVLVFGGSADSIYRVSHMVDLGVVLPERVKVGFTASTNGAEIYRVLSWSFSSMIKSSSAENKNEIKKGLEMAGLVLALVLIIAVFVFILRAGRGGGSGDSPVVELTTAGRREEAATYYPNMEEGPRKFTYLELSQATNGFDEISKLGEGGFGAVYKGRLTNPDGTGLDVAVKKMKLIATSNSERKEGIIKQFKAEAEIISRIRHRNVVRLVGWCSESTRGQLFVVYQFLQNKSLDKHLFRAKSPVLAWADRYKIASGLASGLHYLHEEYDRCVVHRDVKSSNVMLDSDFNPRLGDFGLARITDHDKSLNYTNPAGTIGYMAPEIFQGENASKKTDVYSFGIVALEIATGKKPRSTISVRGKKEAIPMLDWVRDLEGRDRILDAVDQKLGRNSFNKVQAKCLLKLGLKCCDTDPSKRPDMRKVISRLN